MTIHRAQHDRCETRKRSVESIETCDCKRERKYIAQASSESFSCAQKGSHVVTIILGPSFLIGYQRLIFPTFKNSLQWSLTPGCVIAKPEKLHRAAYACYLCTRISKTALRTGSSERRSRRRHATKPLLDNLDTSILCHTKLHHWKEHTADLVLADRGILDKEQSLVVVESTVGTSSSYLYLRYRYRTYLYLYLKLEGANKIHTLCDIIP
eukprot:1185029-Prorocentrum_minimum.AAC.1